MRVILKREVRGLGRPGEVKDVADGYAQNFLLPRGLAIEATAGELKHLAQERDATKAKKDREHGVSVDRAKIHVPEPLRSLGPHTVEVRLLPDVRAKVTVAVEPA